jgi:hypothetical protein
MKELINGRRALKQKLIRNATASNHPAALIEFKFVLLN